jgi:hypothetical protein
MVMNSTELERDERTIAVENASYKIGYILLTYALLADVMYRGFRHEAAWDLLALIVIGGGVCVFYQARQKILSRGWQMKAVLVMCIAFVVGVVMALVRVKGIR